MARNISPLIVVRTYPKSSNIPYNIKRHKHYYILPHHFHMASRTTDSTSVEFHKNRKNEKIKNQKMKNQKSKMKNRIF